MVDERRCPRCGAALFAEGSPCRRCLLALGLETVGSSLEAAPSRLASVEWASGPSERVGPFRIVDVLVVGETSTTYLAREDGPAGRRVLLRVVEPRGDNAQALARFAAERDALAGTHHPGLVSQVDAGETGDGRLWFAAEWVVGVPITEYCDRERLALRQRLEAFVEACEAIGHAHARGLRHLHLEASRLLVTEEGGRPRSRVLGFGMAGALGRLPVEQMLYSPREVLGGTFGYLGPEQLTPGTPVLDVRTDVYALGVVLYELLVGVKPFEPRRLQRAGWLEMARIIRDESPRRPSAMLASLGVTRSWEVADQRRTEPRRLARGLRGDLDWIALKALEKEPGRRHASAAELGQDLRRLLDGEPVAPGLRSTGRRLLRALGRSRPL